MENINKIIAKNLKRLRKFKNLSQKEVSAKSGVPQGQNSRIENGRIEPSISTLEKLADVFEVSISEFFKTTEVNEEVNLPLLEKIKLIDSLGNEEKQAFFKIIHLAISNKRLKENLQNLITS